MDKLFNFKRFGLLLKKDVAFGYRLAGLILLTALIIATVGFFTNDDHDFHYEIFPGIILIAGFIYTSMSFNELHTQDQRHVFLSLPASNLEKFLSKLLLSSIGFAAVLTLAYWLFSLLFNALVYNGMGIELQAFNPFQEDIWQAISLFLVIQSLFLLGSVYFNHYAFLKTSGSLFVFALALAVVAYLLARIFLAKHFDGWAFRPHNVVPSATMESFMEGNFTTLAKFLFWYVLAPFLWVVAFFKLKEREV